MGDTVTTILKWAVRGGIVLAALFVFIVMLNTTISAVFISLNQNVLSDLFAIIQIWLPFNMNVLLGWIITTSLMYLTYRLTLLSLAFINKIIGTL